VAALHVLSTRYCTAGVDKRVRSTSLHHCRQCNIALKPRSDRTDHSVVCVMMHDCSRKLQKHCTSASRVWIKQTTWTDRCELRFSYFQCTKRVRVQFISVASNTP